MKFTKVPALQIYAAALSTAVAAVLVMGAVAPKTQTLDELRVHRIDVVEPDGTLRMVISNKARLPGVIIKGQEQPPMDRPQAGMIFYNDEGTENGGLIFGGRKNEKGDVVDSGGSLTFDKYGANQIVQLMGVDDREDKLAGLAVSDGRRRIWVGRKADGASAVALMDAKGRERLRLRVSPEGEGSLEFLDDKGAVIQRMTPKPN